MNQSFINERINATKALIVVYEDALAAIAGGVQSYTLDTGQDRQTVTRYDVEHLNEVLDSLYNRLATLNARLNGGSTIARPAW